MATRSDNLARIERKLRAAEDDGHVTLARLVRDYIEANQLAWAQIAAEGYAANDHMQHRVRRTLTKHGIAVRPEDVWAASANLGAAQ